MRKRIQLTLLTEAEVVKAMGPFSFGEDTVRTTPLLVNTLAQGLMQIAAGFRIGGTLHGILRDMGMITVRRGNLTKLGREFMFDCFNGTMAIYEPKIEASPPASSDAAGTPAPQAGHTMAPSGSACGTPSAGTGLRDAAGATP